MEEKRIIHVVAAVIKKNDLILATQRGYGEFKGMWEFPGGKIEEGENLEEALVREINEELDTIVDVEKYLCTVNYDYPNFHLIMDTFICSLKDDKLNMVYHNDNELEHEDYKWLTIKNIEEVNWLPADIEIVNELKKISTISR